MTDTASPPRRAPPRLAAAECRRDRHARLLDRVALAGRHGAADAQTQRPTRFWNLTRHTISELSLAPAGTTNFGPNQCKNDKDGTVDPDERLRVTGVPRALMTCA